MKILFLFLAAIALVMNACVSELDPVIYPEIDYAAITSTTAPLTIEQRAQMNGIYILQEGRNAFGDTVAVRWDGEAMSIYTIKSVSFFYVRGGMRTDSARFVGYWRAVQGPETGQVSLSILASEGGKDLAAGKGNGVGLILRGEVTSPGSLRPTTVVLTKIKALANKSRGFEIIGHRGGGRNSDRLGKSENSIELMLFASQLGATACEIDIYGTSDGIPVVFHDPTFTPRTVRGAYLVGDISNYSLKQIRGFVRLVNGEPVPTLEDALMDVVDKSSIRTIWLDNKDPSVVDEVLAIHKRVMDHAATKRRSIRILFGIPTVELYDAYMKSPLKGTAPVLCELDLASVRASNAAVWAPRFTNGLQADVVDLMHKEGRDVYCWTMDDPAFILRFLTEGDFDGFCTNYPTLLAALFYTRKELK
ncbi:hypothetical protein BH10BAC6_BH10BAC6_11950 [soil metagenome]